MRLIGPFFLCASIGLLIWAHYFSSTPSASQEAAGQAIHFTKGDPPIVGAPIQQKAHPLLLVNLFASWCTPCITELPYLKTLREQSGIPLIGIAYHDKTQNVIDWLHQHGNPFDAVYLDERGALLGTLTVRGVPETMILNAQGQVVFRHSGVVTEPEVAEFLQQLKALQPE